MKKINIGEIEKATLGVLLKGNREEQIVRISTDSRNVDNLTLFIPLKGDRFDGHDFIEQVIGSGCKTIIASDFEKIKAFLNRDLNIIIVDDTLIAMQSLAKYYLAHLNIKKIAVTGSVGKTSTRDMLKCICSKKFITGGTVGNYNNDVGVPLTIFSLDEEVQVAIIEMGMDHFNEIHRLAEIVRPQVSVITNVGTSHMENLGSREGIRKAKLEIVDYFTKEDTLVYNRACDLLTDEATEGTYKRLSVGYEKEDFVVKDIEDFGEKGISFSIVADRKQYRIKLNVPGAHNALNAALAIAAARTIGVSIEESIEGLETLELTGKRLTIKEGKCLKVIDDTYNASPESTKSAINTLISSEGNRKIAILGDMYELGKDTHRFHEEVGIYAAQKGVDIVIGVGDLGEHIFWGLAL